MNGTLHLRAATLPFLIAQVVGGGVLVLAAAALIGSA